MLPAGATAGFWQYYLPAGEGRKVLTPDPGNLLTSRSGVLHGIMDHVPRPRWNPTTPFGILIVDISVSGTPLTGSLC